MAHQRTNIRNALKAMLIGAVTVDEVTTYATLAENRVYANRAFNMDKAKLPAIHIYDESEAISDRVTGAQRLLRKVAMKIELTVQNSSNVDTDLDDLAKEVEDIISQNRNLSATCSFSLYQGMETQFDPAERTIGRAILNYEITYLT